MSVWVNKRVLPNGKSRFDVKYRIGGRMGRDQGAGGGFHTKREADARVGKVREWIALGLDPREQLDALTSDGQTSPPVSEQAEAWLAAQYHLASPTMTTYRTQVKRICEINEFGKVRLDEIEPATIIEWIAAARLELENGTVRQYMTTLRQVLDVLDPNPARHRTVKMPPRPNKTIDPPSADDVYAMLRDLPAKWRYVCVVLEQTGMRITEAIKMSEGDIDRANNRILVRKENAKNGRARWIPVAPWLMEILTPLEGVTENGLARTMRKSSERYGGAKIWPHLLRHRRASIWHMTNVPVAQAAQWLGHSAEVHLDTYAHVIEVDECQPSVLLQILSKNPLYVVPSNEDAAHAGDDLPRAVAHY